MILKRKPSAPIIKDSFGIEHDNIIIGFFALPEDKLNKWIEIRCGYFHDVDIYQTRKDKFLNDVDTNLINFTIRFDESSIPALYENNQLIKLGYPDYDSLKQSIDINPDGSINVIANDVLYWILNQEFIKDFEGKVFNENWEIDVNL